MYSSDTETEDGSQQMGPTQMKQDQPGPLVVSIGQLKDAIDSSQNYTLQLLTRLNPLLSKVPQETSSNEKEPSSNPNTLSEVLRVEAVRVRHLNEVLRDIIKRLEI